MKKLLRQFRHGQRGFTLIELLIVVAILGVIAAVVIPNATGFMTTGTLNAANTEAQNVKTAAIAYYAEQDPPDWPDTSAVLYPVYITGTLKATYNFNSDTGLIDSVAGINGGWDLNKIHWDEPDQLWKRGPSGSS